MDEQHASQIYDEGIARSRRHLGSFAASLATHAAIVGMLVMFAAPLARTHREWVLAYLVVVGDGASGRGGAGAAAPGASSIHVDSARRARKAAAARQRRRAVTPASQLASPAGLRPVAQVRPVAAPASGNAAVSRDSGSGSGTAPDSAAAATAAAGSAGAGTPDSTAHADYASSPPPSYPAVARRREQQGTVTVRVLVAPDGSVERAEIAESSGFDALDSAALETVRSRWRFVPARHGGFAVESWVLVPIRFALVEARAAR